LFTAISCPGTGRFVTFSQEIAIGVPENVARAGIYRIA